MSISSNSRDRPEPASLASVLQQVLADETLSKPKRDDLASAIRTVARALGRQPEDLPAHPGDLSGRLKGFAPAAAGLSESRWRNALSLTRAALMRVGIASVPGRSNVPFAPAWTALFGTIKRMTDRMALSRLARYCTERGIDPNEVDDGVFANFLADLTNRALIDQPKRVHRRAAVTWNRMVSTIRNWPSQLVTVPNYSRTYVVPWEKFPDTLKADLDNYLACLSGNDILSDLSCRPLRASSIRTIGHQIRGYIAGLVLSGEDPQALRTLRDIVAIDRVKKGLRFVHGRSRQGTTKTAHDLARVLVAVARHWAKVNEEHLAALRDLRKRLDPGNKGMSAGNRERLRQFDAPENVRALLGLPEMLMNEVARVKKPTPATALLVQTALAVEFLLMVPIRRKNLAHLNIGRHLRPSRSGVMHLVIPAAEMKNHAPYEARLPASVVKLIDIYLQRYRPFLLTTASPWLFPGLADRPKSCERLAFQITETVRKRCGLKVHLHLFRHLSAKLFLDINPGQYGVIRLLHGHRSVETTTNFYYQLEADAAVKVYDNHVTSLRDQPPVAPGGGK